MNIFDIAKQNQEKAWQVIKNTNIIQIWEDAGAKINLIQNDDEKIVAKTM